MTDERGDESESARGLRIDVRQHRGDREAIADGLSSRMSVEMVEVGAAPQGDPRRCQGARCRGTHPRIWDEQTGNATIRRRAGSAWSGVCGDRAARVARNRPTRIGESRGGRVRHASDEASLAGGFGRAGCPEAPPTAWLRIISPPESFYVKGTPGPLLTGEEERARQWAQGLGSQLAAPEPVRPF
jgi:hypothetical protein